MENSHIPTPEERRRQRQENGDDTGSKANRIMRSIFGIIILEAVVAHECCRSRCRCIRFLFGMDARAIADQLFQLGWRLGMDTICSRRGAHYLRLLEIFNTYL